MIKAKEWIVFVREGVCCFVLCICCLTFVLQVDFFALVKLSIDVPDLSVNHFGKIVGRGGTVIFVCYFIVRPFLTCFLVRG